jgi:hypothetical protein
MQAPGPHIAGRGSLVPKQDDAFLVLPAPKTGLMQATSPLLLLLHRRLGGQLDL